MFLSGQFHVAFRTVKIMTLGGELQYFRIIIAMIADGGRGHCVWCRGPDRSCCGPAGFGGSESTGSWACSENKQLQPAEGPRHWPYSSQQQVSHQVPALPSRTRKHTCAAHTHGRAHTHTHKFIEANARAHTHTHRWECKGGPGTTYREQRRKSGKNAASSNKSHHNAETNPQPHPQKCKKNLVSLFQSSQKCLTKAQIENILDKRIQAPFWKGPHTKLCVIPTRNWFIYQKIIRFNAKALRLQIKDNKRWVD